MGPLLQITLGVGFGLLGVGILGLLTYSAFQQPNNGHQYHENPDYRELPHNTRRDDIEEMNYRSQPGDRCTICLNVMNNSDMCYMPCQHALHHKCLQALVSFDRCCPICRKRFDHSL